MGVAERMGQASEGAVGFEAVVDDDTARKVARHVAPLVRHAVEGEAFGCGRMKPLRFAGDAEAGFVEAAHARGGDERADPPGDRRKRAGFSPHPVHDARRTDGRDAEEIGERLSRPLLGDQLLQMQIDGRRAQPLAILRRRLDAIGKGRPRAPAAAGAGVNGPPVLGDFDQLLRQVEHLARLHLPRHRERQAGSAMATGGRFVQHDPVRIGDPLERIALVASLSPARLARGFAQAHRLLPQSVARRRLRTRRTVEAKPALQIGVLRPQGRVLALKLGHPRLERLDPALKPFNEAANSRREAPFPP